MAKVQAIGTLAKKNVPVPKAQINDHVRWAISVGEELATYQSQRAVSMAARLLDLSNSTGELEYPSETPDALVARSSYWPFRTFDPRGRSPYVEWEESLRRMTEGQRDRWRERESGRPPWPLPRPVPPTDDSAESGVATATEAANLGVLQRWAESRWLASRTLRADASGFPA